MADIERLSDSHDGPTRWNTLRAFIAKERPPLPPDFWLPPRTEDERKVKTQIIHTLLALAYSEPSCECDDCKWVREQLEKEKSHD